MHRTRVDILTFPCVEVLDFYGPYDRFTVTRINPLTWCWQPRLRAP